MFTLKSIDHNPNCIITGYTLVQHRNGEPPRKKFLYNCDIECPIYKQQKRIAILKEKSNSYDNC